MFWKAARRAHQRPAGSYQTSDGWMMVTLVNEPQYKRLCAAIGREDLASDPRFADLQAARRGCADLAVAGVVPCTADEAWLSRLHDILRQLARRPFPDGRVPDEAGGVRLLVKTMTWEDYVHLAFDEFRMAGAGSPRSRDAWWLP